MPITPANEKRNALLARKEKILQNIKYYDNRLKDFRDNASSSIYFENSSDSDDDFPVTINNDPSMPQLKLELSMLQTCLQATQELTSLQVLQSEVNVMVEDPVIEGECPVKEPGSWREVTAECRIDLVPFSITFFVHQPIRHLGIAHLMLSDGVVEGCNLYNMEWDLILKCISAWTHWQQIFNLRVCRLFAPTSYHCLKVLPVKIAHEGELSKSILPGLTRPGDAIEVLRSYAAAYRSRRTTLARLADKYAHSLFMEPLAEGGYFLKCADLLEMSWRLENKWSPVAAFHHRMKFDLEYMDESCIKIITQAHRQLSDPSIETDERTMLLAKIISTCLEAQGPTQELHESMESDPESIKKLEKRRTTLDQELEAPAGKRKRDAQAKDDKNNKESEKANDHQIMAPPKSLPKKVKPKGKENLDQNRKAVKRSNVDESSSNVKKAKTDEIATNDIREDVKTQNEAGSVQDEADNAKKSDRSETEVNIDKNKAKVNTSHKHSEKDNIKSTGQPKDVIKSKKNDDPKNKIVEKKNTDNTGSANEIQEKTKNKTVTKIPNLKKADGKDKLVASSKNDPKPKEPVSQKVTSKEKTVASSKNDQKTNENITKKNTLKSKDGSAKELVPTDQAIQNDQPKSSKNVDKKPTNENKNKTKIPKVPAPTAQSTNDSDKIAKKNVEKAKKLNKPETDTKIANPDKKTNSQNAKKAAINKENVKASKTENAIINKDKIVQKTSANNKPDAKKADKPKNNERNPELDPPNNTEAQKQDIIKTKATVDPKNKNTINAKIPKEIITNEAKNSNPQNDATKKKIKENVKQQSNKNPKGDESEQVVKVKNVAIKTKEHIADLTETKIVALDKEAETKIGKRDNVQNKIVIKNLSHKNLSAQNRLSKKSITGNTDKDLKAGSAAKIGKANVSDAKITKIPQKKLSPVSETALMRNRLRISPRKFPSTFKSISDSNLKQKSLKYTTNIPRLMKKPEPKQK